MKESFIKKAPYTVLILFFICLFWGYKAISASGQIRIPFLEDGRVSFPSENEKLPDNTIPESKTDEIAFIPATLGEAAPSGENADSGEETGNVADSETSDIGGSSEPGANDNNGQGNDGGIKPDGGKNTESEKDGLCSFQGPKNKDVLPEVFER